MVFKNYYKILDLQTSDVSIEEIKLAYRQAAKKYHPDLNVGDKLAEERIKDINEAYNTLSVPSSKRKYDRIWNSHFKKEQKAFAGRGEKGSILQMFIGDVETQGTKTENKKRNGSKGENIETSININVQEAFFGVKKVLSLRTPEGKNKRIEVTIPEGIVNGEKIRLIGQGKPSENNGNNGDLIIRINIEDSSNYKLKGTDLYTDLLLSPWEAALGTRATINSIDDEIQIYIPQGIQTGERIKIPGKGYKNSEGKRGDLFAKIKVVVPKQLTKQEKDLFEKLDKVSNFNPRN